MILYLQLLFNAQPFFNNTLCMKHILFVLAIALFSVPSCAQGQAQKPAPETKTENKVVVKDGKTYVVSTTVNQVETSAELVGQKVDQLKAQKDKLLGEIAKLDENIRELLSLEYDLRKAEAKLKPKDKAGEEKKE